MSESRTRRCRNQYAQIGRDHLEHPQCYEAFVLRVPVDAYTQDYEGDVVEHDGVDDQPRVDEPQPEAGADHHHYHQEGKEEDETGRVGCGVYDCRHCGSGFGHCHHLMRYFLRDLISIKRCINDANIVNKDNVSYYVYTINVNSAQMTENIEIGLSRNNNYIYIDDISVAEYANYIIEHSEDNDEYNATKEVVNAMLNYGKYCQIFFDYNIDSLVNENVDDNISDVIIDTSEIPDYILNGNITGLTYYGSSLVLQGETSIKHYFEIADEKDSESILNDYTFICEGEEIKPVIKNGYLY